MSSVSRKPRTFKPATEPATGVCRWSLRPVLPSASNVNGQPGLLTITTEKRGEVGYLVMALADQVQDGVVIRGFSMSKPCGEVHHLDAGNFLACDCPDHNFHPERPGGCRHMAALRAALAVVGLHYSVPTPSGPASASKPAYRSAGAMAANDPEAWDEHLNDVA